MLERIIAACANAIAWMFIRQAERGSTAVDAERDLGRSRRARRALRDWLRKQDGARQGGRSDEDRT